MPTTKRRNTGPSSTVVGEWASDAGLNDGIFGGLDPEQRKARRRLGVLTR